MPEPVEALRRAVDELTLLDYIALALAPTLMQNHPASDGALAKDAYALAAAFLAERLERSVAYAAEGE